MEDKKVVNIYFEANPNPNSLKFVADFMLVEEGKNYDFPNKESTKNAPLANKLFELEKGIMIKGKTIVRETGRAYIKRVISHIQKQDIKLFALKASTVARKGHSRYYIDTGKFLAKLKH